MKAIIEAKYLSVDNAPAYRQILRFFYLQHERMRDFIHPAEVLEYLRKDGGYPEMAEEQLHAHLDQLTKWNNLARRQDMTSARTIEEFKKKRYSYQCTPMTVELERMILELERRGDEVRGSLEKSQFDRLLQAVQALEIGIAGKLPQPDEVNILYEEVIDHFRKIRTHTADYIAYINREQAGERMQPEAFLAYKNQFTTYLREFVVSLQRASLQLKLLLNEMDTDRMAPLFDLLIEYRLSVPRLDDTPPPVDEWRRNYEGYWTSLRGWFLGFDGSQSELELLEWQTNEMIRRVARHVQRLGERQQHFRSRKKEYLKLAEWFAGFDVLDEAHRLSGAVFGPMTIRHLRLLEGTTDDIHAEVWEEEPEYIEIQPRTNRYREKTRPGAVTSKKKEKALQMQAYLEEREKERALIDRYIDAGRIRLSETGTVEPFIRKLLLGWIGKSAGAKDRTVVTDYGYLVKVTLHSDRRITLRSGDGDLVMPDATFEFTEGRTS